MTVITRQHGRVRKPFLGCLADHKRGPEVCLNKQLVPMAKVDQAVRGALASDVLDLP